MIANLSQHFLITKMIYILFEILSKVGCITFIKRENLIAYPEQRDGSLQITMTCGLTVYYTSETEDMFVEC